MTMEKQSYIPIRMTLDRLDLPRSAGQVYLRRLLGTGRLDAVRLDLYADAAGKDDWNSHDQPWYVVAIAVVREDRAWRQWCDRFAHEYGGDFHLGNRDWCDAHGGHGARPDHIRRLYELRPWQFAQVIIAHRDAVRRSVESMESKPMDPRTGPALLWATQLTGFSAYFREVWRTSVGPHAAKHLIRRIVCDQWAAGDVQAYGANIMEFYGVENPEFVGTPCPGLGVVDGLAWGFRSALKYPTEQILPWPDGQLFDERLFINVLTTSSKPIHCESLLEIRRALAAIP